MTNPIADIEKSDVILITGSNTTENHPVLSSYVKRAVTQKGAQLIVVDPRRIPITKFATHWLRQNLGTDVAWINGMMHVIINEKLYDEDYVNSRTVGLDEVKKIVEKFTPEYVEEITGIDKDQLRAAARLYAQMQLQLEDLVADLAGYQVDGRPVLENGATLRRLGEIAVRINYLELLCKRSISATLHGDDALGSASLAKSV